MPVVGTGQPRDRSRLAQQCPALTWRSPSTCRCVSPGCYATALLSGYESSLTLADPFVLPAIAAFRVFIKNGAWVEPLEDLWVKYGPKTVSALWDTYRESGKSSAAIFGRAKASWRPRVT